MAVNVENSSTNSPSMTQAIKDRAGDAVALAIGVAERAKKKPVEALGVLVVATTFVASAAGYHPEKIVTKPAGLAAKGVEEFAKDLAPAVDAVADFVTAEPAVDQPSQQQVQQNVAQNVIGNMSQDATQAEQAQQLQEHGIAPDIPQSYSEATPLSENSVVSPQVQTDPSLTGGAAPGQISGGSPAKP